MKNSNETTNPAPYRVVIRVVVGTMIALGLMAGGAGMSVALAPEIERPQFASKELPREWQWSPPKVKYEHMYAK